MNATLLIGLAAGIGAAAVVANPQTGERSTRHEIEIPMPAGLIVQQLPDGFSIAYDQLHRSTGDAAISRVLIVANRRG